jgi:hypothetical protein
LESWCEKPDEHRARYYEHLVRFSTHLLIFLDLFYRSNDRQGLVRNEMDSTIFHYVQYLMAIKLYDLVPFYTSLVSDEAIQTNIFAKFMTETTPKVNSVSVKFFKLTITGKDK